MRNRVQVITCTIIYLLILVGCSSKQEALKAEAEAFCRMHDKERWEETRANNPSKTGIDLVVSETRRAVKSDAFLEVFNKLATQGYEDYYQALQSEISNLLGEPWHCDAAKNFYDLEWKLVGVDRAGPEVTAQVLENRAVVIGGKEYAADDTDTIRQALEAEAGGQKYQLLLRLPDGVADDDLQQYVEPFIKVGVDEFTVLD